jgi:hypothetical protein
MNEVAKCEGQPITLKAKLQEKKAGLEKKLALVNTAIAALENAGELANVLEAVNTGLNIDRNELY